MDENVLDGKREDEILLNWKIKLTKFEAEMKNEVAYKINGQFKLEELQINLSFTDVF